MTARWRDRKPPRIDKPDLRVPHWIIWLLIVAFMIAVVYAAWVTFGGCACR